jgi:phosphatidylglycerol:prolipoprotein diacylglycerol transferase
MLLGIALTAAYWIRLGRQDGRFLLIYLGALCGAFLGGKLGYILVEGWSDLHQPDRWLRLATGKTILGALLGGYGGVEAAKKWIGWKQVTGDRFAMVAPLGIILGRLGCLLHGCCLGAVCTSQTWWTLKDRAGIPRWPAVPVEIGFNIFALAGLTLLRRRGLFSGQHFHLYLIAYGIFRFLHEFWRATPRAWGMFSGYQLLALAVVGLGAWGYIHRRRSLPSLTQSVASQR